MPAPGVIGHRVQQFLRDPLPPEAFIHKGMADGQCIFADLFKNDFGCRVNGIAQIKTVFLLRKHLCASSICRLESIH